MYYSILLDTELDFMMETAKAELRPGDTYVEIGSFALGTIGRIANACPYVACYAVDVLDHNWLDSEESPTRDYLQKTFPDQEWSSEAVMQLIHRIEAVTQNLRLHRGYSRSWVFPDAALQFIDADHSYEQVLADFWHCWAQARPGSLLVGHDYQIEDTQRAVHDIERWFNGRALRPAGNMWAFRKV
jgi:hypothetical protein